MQDYVNLPNTLHKDKIIQDLKTLKEPNDKRLINLLKRLIGQEKYQGDTNKDLKIC